MNDRRRLLFALGLGALAGPLGSFAQLPGKVWRIGFLAYGVPSRYREDHPFVQHMRELGYVEGRNLSIEWRDAEGQLERLPQLAAELVNLKVAALVTLGTPATASAQKASAVVPVVMVGVGDPVRDGFVKTLARPGGNITGLTNLTPELYQKHLEMLLSVRPKLARVAMLVESANIAHTPILKNVRAAALAVGVAILPVEAQTGAEIPQAISLASREKAEAILVTSGLFAIHLRQIAELAVQHRLLTISAFPAFPT